MVLVTGGTGLLGSHLLLRLLRDDVPVRAIHRKGSDLKRVEKVFSYYTENAAQLFQKIEWKEADLSDIPALELAFTHVDFVYHAAALISFDPGDYSKLKKINAEGTANIVNLCIARKIKKLCYVSTIGAIGKSLNGAIATEENQWIEQDANVYALTKYAAEMEVWRGSQEGLLTVILNPGLIIGPGFWDSGTGNLFTTANKGYRFFPPGGTGFITVGDVVHMMVSLMDSPIINERFIAVAKNISFEEILTRLADGLGKPMPTKKLKLWQLQIGRTADWVWDLFTNRGRRITKNSIKSLYQRDDYGNGKIRKALGFEFEPLEDTIQFCCEKFREENP